MLKPEKQIGVRKLCWHKICSTKKRVISSHRSTMRNAQYKNINLTLTESHLTDKSFPPSPWQRLVPSSPLMLPILPHWGFGSIIQFETGELSASCKEKKWRCSRSNWHIEYRYYTQKKVHMYVRFDYRPLKLILRQKQTHTQEENHPRTYPRTFKL